MSLYITSIIEFIDSLRTTGLKIGLAESMAAMEAIEHVGLENRNAVKIALSSCLAKSEEDQHTFAKAFDGFFISLAAHDQNRQQTIQKTEIHEKALQESAQALKFQDTPLELSEDQLVTYANLGQEEKHKIQNFLEKTSTGKNVSPKFKFVAEQIIKSKLNSVSSKNQQAGSGSSLLTKNIAAISDEEVPSVLRLINIMVKQINGAITRKYKRSGKRKTLDIKGTIHNSLHTGGTFYKLKFKSKPLQRQRLIMLCDISASMYRFSGFALQFVLGMNTVADKTESFLFSEGIEHVQSVDLSSMSAFEQRVTSSSLLNKGTNISTALTYLLENRDVPLGRSTVVLILSDAKTLETQKTCDLLHEIGKRSKKIIWMNPIPEKDWVLLPWLECFRTYCTMLDCSTIDRLASACAQSPVLLS